MELKPEQKYTVIFRLKSCDHLEIDGTYSRNEVTLVYKGCTMVMADTLYGILEQGISEKQIEMELIKEQRSRDE